MPIIKKTTPDRSKFLDSRSLTNKITMADREVEGLKRQLSTVSKEERIYPRLQEELQEAEKNLKNLLLRQQKKD